MNDYVVEVLFGAFALSLVWPESDWAAQALSSAVIAGIAVLGWTRGLAGLERAESVSVGLKLAVIMGLLGGMGLHTWGLWQQDALQTASGHFDWNALRLAFGLIITVQGFETSRYLGSAYDATTRIHTMRYAQWISTAIYLAFILLITRYFTDGLPSQGGETAIIDMLKPIGSALAPMIIVAALASQLSAAVADTNGAGGLLSETFSRKLSINFASAATAPMVRLADRRECCGKVVDPCAGVGLSAGCAAGAARYPWGYARTGDLFRSGSRACRCAMHRGSLVCRWRRSACRRTA